MKGLSWVLAAMAGVVAVSASRGAEPAPKRVLMVVNEGFQPDEYFVPRKLFEAAGYAIRTASRYGGEVRPGRKYPEIPSVKADLQFSEIRLEEFDAIAFAGGGGAWSDYFPVPAIHRVLAEALNTPRLVVGMICASTGLLATANNLDGRTPIAKGRHVTGYPEVEGLLRLQGKVNYEKGDLKKPLVVQDGNLITARDPLSAEEFGKRMVAELFHAGKPSRE